MMSSGEKCVYCGLEVGKVTSQMVTHPYFGAHPYCYDLFNQVIAREFNNPAYFAVHRLTVDTYAVQHPGDAQDRRAVQSVNIHLMALYLMIVEEATHNHIIKALKRAADGGKDSFAPLAPPEPLAYSLTIADVLPAVSAREHVTMVRAWSEHVWNVWAAHHDTAQHLAKTYSR